LDLLLKFQDDYAGMACLLPIDWRHCKQWQGQDFKVEGHKIIGPVQIRWF